MFLNTKTLSILFIFSFFFLTQAKAQEEESAPTDSSYAFEKDDHYGIITFGLSKAISVGGNFAKDSFKGSVGFDFNFLFNLFETPWLLGIEYGVIYNSIENQIKIGNYEHSNIIRVGGLVGYQFFPRNDFRLLLKAGVGSVTYKNITAGRITFLDYGTTVAINPELSYHFTKNFGLYFSTEFRTDFLSIETPQEVESQFKNPYYITPTIGVRIVF